MPTTNINVSKGFVPTIELIGDWGKATKFLNGQLQAAVLVGAKQGQLSAAKKLVSIVKKNIRRNGPNGTYWPRYSYLYEMSKVRRGGNIDKFWRLTETYYNSIVVMDRGLTVHAGVPKNVKGRANPKKPLTLGEIAVILERGSVSANIQARPLWRPSFKEFGGKTRVGTHMIFHIRKNVFIMSGLRSASYKMSLK